MAHQRLSFLYRLDVQFNRTMIQAGACRESFPRLAIMNPAPRCVRHWSSKRSFSAPARVVAKRRGQTNSFESC
jgi:hypothetical protein